jgi:hypothetical protein
LYVFFFFCFFFLFFFWFLFCFFLDMFQWRQTTVLNVVLAIMSRRTHSNTDWAVVDRFSTPLTVGYIGEELFAFYDMINNNDIC